jgi:hypothetical protein
VYIHSELMMSENYTNENQVVHILGQQQFKFKDMKEVRANETVISTTNKINTSIINVALKVNKLKKCV